jgi:hypothetical protein
MVVVCPIVLQLGQGMNKEKQGTERGDRDLPKVLKQIDLPSFSLFLR